MNSTGIKIVITGIICSIFMSLALGLRTAARTIEIPPVAGRKELNSVAWQEQADDWAIYMPVLRMDELLHGLPVDLPKIARVNAPLLDEIRLTQGAVLWFGQVTPDGAYADVRVGYTATSLFVHLNIADRLLWYDSSPKVQDLLQWDAASLYVSQPRGQAYRFDGQLSWWESRSGYQAAWRLSAQTWQPATIPFSTSTTWRGNAPNDDRDDDGWSILYTIPFSSLGLSTAPAAGSVWKVGLRLYDRDDVAGSPRSVQSWPAEFNEQNQDSWAILVFGLPVYSPPSWSIPSGTTTIRHKLDGAVVQDGMVGGGMLCGGDLNKWSQWGSANYAGAEQVNIQNQLDISDRPCFSKFYITFPLERIPAGKLIHSAELTLYQFGNAGGGVWGDPPSSLIQVLTIKDDWNEATLTWNNAPYALENISRLRVDPVIDFPGWPGVPRVWDISRAVSQAYHSGEPLRLVFYSTDGPMHTGKYFISSDTGDWNELGRPSLTVRWGEP